ncbi:MAG TPA: phosphoenolpyruvate synthase regulatory protein, partial [Aminobacterium sp.]|nr:phosphoenolpyruvate synthase regulatory protein [Aminobacterium sp.]
EYFKRVKAVEFTINCDDGSNTNLLPEADIVLIGVSRTCKTPLSMYLAHKGLKTANIPLIPSLAPPEELFKIDSSRIIGLTIDAENLVDIRVKRLSMLGLDPGESDYTEKSKVYDELQYAQTIMSSLGVRVFNVTDRALEETAQEILAYFRR